MGIADAFLEVRGRPSTPLEQATWDPQVKAGKAWFAPIVSKERTQLKAALIKAAEGKLVYAELAKAI